MKEFTAKILFLLIVIIILTLSGCSQTPFKNRPDLITESLTQRIEHLKELNDDIYTNYTRERYQTGYALAWEMVAYIRSTEDYINLAVYYIQTTGNPTDKSNTEFTDKLLTINRELLHIIIGDDPPIKPYIDNKTNKPEEYTQTRDDLDEIFSKINRYISELKKL
jgi:hypothetical protein